MRLAWGGGTVRVTQYVIYVLRNVTPNYGKRKGLEMNVKELIDAAVKNSGTGQSELAKELDLAPARISELKSGKRKADASEIAFFAEKAGLPVLQTVAQIQGGFDPRFAPIWARALGSLADTGLAMVKS